MPETTELPVAEVKQSPVLTILSSALSQVNEVLGKAESTLQLLQQNISQVSAQKIGLTHQQGMLTELITRIDQAEKANK